MATFSTSCESHTSEMPFRVVSRLLRDVLRIDDDEHEAARSALRTRFAQPIPKICVCSRTCSESEIGSRKPRHLRGGSTAASGRAHRHPRDVARPPTVYIIEDVHWIDAASESMLADLLTMLRGPGRWW